MATPTSKALPVAGSELRTRTAPVLESIALRHQIAVRGAAELVARASIGFDRLLWILLSRWWPQWRESLMIVQAETVLRWRRNGWSAIWGYRSRGRWRGGRPRLSSEVRPSDHADGPWELSGVRHGSMASFSCSGSQSPKPPCRVTCLSRDKPTRQVQRRSIR
jgi:hypothetical protein